MTRTGVMIATAAAVLSACSGADTDTGTDTEPEPDGDTFYVSRSGSDLDGASWLTAWSELDQVDWAAVGPGDLVLIDGADAGMEYRTTLEVAASGEAAHPIFVRAAQAAGHGGPVRLFGGRATPLPDCGDGAYVYETAGVSESGVVVEDQSYIVIDGMRAGGIVISGHDGPGIRLGAGSSHVTVRNAEISDNGIAFRGGYVDGAPVEDDAGPWNPGYPGVLLSGSHHVFERVVAHDNGEDSFQSSGGLLDFTLRLSWLHNTRTTPGDPRQPFNYCAHTDGIQVWAGGAQSGVTVEDSVMGPGLDNGLILGDTGGTHVDDVTVTNTLFVDVQSNDLYGAEDSAGWIVDHVTSYMLDGCVWEVDGTGHSVTNSVFDTGCFNPQGPPTEFSGNCFWQTDTLPTPANTNADPLFVGPMPDVPDPSLDFMADIDLTPGPGTGCPAGAGASITSVAALLSAIGY